MCTDFFQKFKYGKDIFKECGNTYLEYMEINIFEIRNIINCLCTVGNDLVLHRYILQWRELVYRKKITLHKFIRKQA